MVYADLIPSLDSSRNRVQNDRVVQRPRMPPAVRNLVDQCFLFALFQVRDRVNGAGILRNQGTLLQEWEDVSGKVVLFVETLDILQEGFPRQALERVADLTLHILGELDDASLAASLVFNGNVLSSIYQLVRVIGEVTVSKVDVTPHLDEGEQREGKHTRPDPSPLRIGFWFSQINETVVFEGRHRCARAFAPQQVDRNFPTSVQTRNGGKGAQAHLNPQLRFTPLHLWYARPAIQGDQGTGNTLIISDQTARSIHRAGFQTSEPSHPCPASTLGSSAESGTPSSRTRLRSPIFRSCHSVTPTHFVDIR